MAIDGLGRKSAACILLLALRLQDFPVDTNVGRICSRLGWAVTQGSAETVLVLTWLMFLLYASCWFCRVASVEQCTCSWIPLDSDKGIEVMCCPTAELLTAPGVHLQYAAHSGCDNP
jgi:hypothetical protein